MAMGGEERIGDGAPVSLARARHGRTGAATPAAMTVGRRQAFPQVMATGGAGVPTMAQAPALGAA